MFYLGCGREEEGARVPLSLQGFVFSRACPRDLRPPTRPYFFKVSPPLLLNSFLGDSGWGSSLGRKVEQLEIASGKSLKLSGSTRPLPVKISAESPSQTEQRKFRPEQLPGRSRHSSPAWKSVDHLRCPMLGCLQPVQ